VQPGSVVPVRYAVCDGASPDNREYVLSYAEPLTRANEKSDLTRSTAPRRLPC